VALVAALKTGRDGIPPSWLAARETLAVAAR